MLPRLAAVARSRGKRLALKFSNTLVVKNHRRMFSDEVMYMSGPPLHVLTLNLVKQFRAAHGRRLSNLVLRRTGPAQRLQRRGDELRAGDHLHRPAAARRLRAPAKYLQNLGARMREMGAPRIPDFIVRYAGRGEAAIDTVADGLARRFPDAAAAIRALVAGRLKEWIASPDPYLPNPGRRGAPLDEVCAGILRDFASAAVPQLTDTLLSALRTELAGLEQMLVETAGVLNTPGIVDRTTADPRYRWERNKAVPRKIGSKLWLYDCISCDKCVPVCPNDANFVYESASAEIAYSNYELLPGGEARPVAGGIFRIAREHQFANYADACNDCGNCDVFCPEDGGPQIEKPRFFGSLESYQKYAGNERLFPRIRRREHDPSWNHRRQAVQTDMWFGRQGGELRRSKRRNPNPDKRPSGDGVVTESGRRRAA